MAPPPAVKNFHQHQPITTGLRTICESYPPGTCLRELLQNADDAGATVVEYVLDTNTYSNGPLLYDGLKEYQGPALLARNNSVFRDEDFTSLSSVGDSRKRHEASSTGKFGQGFNSVYHWTDGPWVYSRNLLLLLDPHEEWSVESGQPGGPTWDVVEQRENQEIQNHLQTFRAFNLDVSQEIDETIIRIPLRTKGQAITSKIVTREITIEEIKDALDQFGREVREGGLLFLKHIQKVTVRINDDVIWEAKILQDCPRSLKSVVVIPPSSKLMNAKPHRARQEIPVVFKEVFTPTSERDKKHGLSKLFNLDVEFTIGDVPTVYRYLVHHTMTRSSGNKELDEWAREQKLFGWVAVAAPIEHHEGFMGRLFSTLRLPILTNHPVHLHGLFSITPDRGRLTSSGQSRGSEEFATKWNDFLFTDCISSAWADLLLYRSSVSWYKEGFGLWPRVTELSNDQWNRLDDDVIDQILRKELSVWPTAKKCVSVQEGFFTTTTSETVKYAQTLAEAQVAAVFLEKPLYEKLQQRSPANFQINWMTPKTVRQCLRYRTVSASLKMPRPLLKLLLEFCLLDAQQMSDGSSRRIIYEDLDGIAFWPTLNGSLASKREFDLLLPRDSRERELFADTRKPRTIDINGLTNQTLELLRRDIDLVPRIRYRRLADLSEDWPIMYPTIEPSHGSKAWTLRPSTYDEQIIGSVWTWICARLKEGEQLPSQVDDLWLLPTNSFRLRQYAPAIRSQPLLVIDKGEKLFNVVQNMVERDPDAAPPILDARLLPAVAVKLLQKSVRSIPKLHGACVDHLETILAWLVAGKKLLLTASAEQKRIVLQHVEMLTRNRGSNINERSLAGQIRSLPIFSMISSLPPFTERAITISDLQCSKDGGDIHNGNNANPNHIFEAPMDLPPMPAISGMSLYDLSNQGERYLVERFNLVGKIDIFDLLEQYLLPWAVTVQDGSMVTAKEGLIDFTFKHSQSATSSWATKVSKLPIIPLPLSDNVDTTQYRCLSGMIDPTSSLSGLYFGNENVFPCPRFFQRHKNALKACGLRHKLDWDTVLERVQYFSQCSADVIVLEVNVKCLLQLPIPKDQSMSESSISKLQTLRWLPVNPVSESTMALRSPRECRGSDEHDLVHRILATTRFSINMTWKQVLGWGRIDLDIILRQLDYCLKDNDHGKVGHLLNYIQSNFSPVEYSVLNSKACILGVGRNYLVPKNTFGKSRFLARYPLAPYLDKVDSHFAIEHLELLAQLNVRNEPSVQDLSSLQALLKDSSQGPLKRSDLDVAIGSLEIAARLAGGQEFHDILIPDTESILRPMSDIVYGDRVVTGTIAAFNFTHPAISADLIQRLEIEHSLDRATRLEIEVDDGDEDEYTPRETLSTVISDTLGRYPIDSTFNEFLANADDCRATVVSWILDECKTGPHESLACLTSELKSLQGPALFAYNDEVFKDEDFAGFKDIGQGGKSDDVTTTGMFGRGALTMYHFTDVPSLISGGYLLILDPQQELLTKNKYRKRKAGIKLTLETARRLCQDQLTPFHGLCHYSKELDYFEGTIFRLPFREPGKKSTLTDHVTPVDIKKTKNLLEHYLLSARRSLLFLRNVRSIAFNIRGQPACEWSVSVDHSQGSEQDVFRDVKISAVREHQAPVTATWRVGIIDIEQSPVGIVKPGKGSRKISECGVAACLSDPETSQNVFCKLPTLFSSKLPISIHASFAITGDRRTIPWEDQHRDATMGRWNKWLLSSCIPDLYLNFLKDLAPRLGIAAFNFWPSISGVSSSSLSTVVAKAFWDKIMDDQHIAYELYPKAATESLLLGSTPTQKRVGGKTKKLHAVTSLRCAQFDILPESASKKLRPLLINLCPNLVRPPSHIWQRIKAADTTHLTVELNPAFLCKLFSQEHSCTVLEKFLGSIATGEGQQSKSDALEMFLQAVVPFPGAEGLPLKMLDGCRILPKLDGSLGLLTSDIETEVWTFMATEAEQELFCFASQLLVDTQVFQRHMDTTSSKPTFSSDSISRFRNSIKDILNAPLNVRSLEIGDLGMLLAQPQSPVGPLVLQGSRDIWIADFWTYVNAKSRVFVKARKDDKSESTVMSLISQCGLEDHRVYRYKVNDEWHYITPRQFDEGLYLVEPINKEHFTLCEEIGEFNTVDRASVPFILAETESDLTSSAAFERLVRVLSQVEGEKRVPIQEFLLQTLSEASIRTLQSMLLEYLKPAHAIKFLPELRRLPVWPLFQPSHSEKAAKYLTAERATFCETSKLLLPWVVESLGNLVSPEIVDQHSVLLKALDVHVMSIEELWNHAQHHQPTNMGEISAAEYSAFVQVLALHNIKPSTAIAPNGKGNFCKAMSLYDHDDEIFQSAFRIERTTRFLHDKMQCSRSLHRYWVSLGLRSRGPTKVFNSEDYVQCALAIQVRWQSNQSIQTSMFCQDAEKVAAYLLWDQPSLRNWSSHIWREIALVPMFRVEDNVSSQRIYRRQRMSEVAVKQDHCSLLSIGKAHDVRILWSQLPILKKEPVGFVLENLPRHGKPTAATVFAHLEYIVTQCKRISNEDLPEYIKDIQASYEYLQEDLHSTIHIPGIRESKIFFNIDTTETLFSSSEFGNTLTSAKYLCLNSPVDAGVIKVSRKFLIPYEKLLRALGCKSVIQPTNRAPRLSPYQTGPPIIAAIKQIISLRDQRQLIDVIFEAEGLEKPAHRIFLAAVSDYCKAQFSGEWGSLLAHQAKIQVKEMTFTALSQMIDFAYTGTVDWPEVHDLENNDEIAKKLDELLDLLQATDMWLLKTLHAMTEDKIIDNAATYVRPDNVESVRDIAKDANASNLTSHCNAFIADNSGFVEAARSQE